MITAKLSEVDFNSLSQIISKKLGYYIKFESVIEKDRRGDDRLIFSSNELKQHAGILSSSYKSLKLGSFNAGIFEEGEDEDIKDTIYWTTINFSFELVSGGSNGMQLCSAWFNFTTKEWTIKYQ